MSWDQLVQHGLKYWAKDLGYTPMTWNIDTSSTLSVTSDELTDPYNDCLTTLDVDLWQSRPIVDALYKVFTGIEHVPQKYATSATSCLESEEMYAKALDSLTCE